MRYRCPANGLFTRHIDDELDEVELKSCAYRLLGCLNCMQRCDGPAQYKGVA